MPFIDEDRLYENIEEKYKFAQGEARKAYSDVLDTICEMPMLPFSEALVMGMEMKIDNLVEEMVGDTE